MIPHADIPGADILFKIDLGATVLCFFGSLVMTCYCLRIPQPRNISIDLILCIAISDFLYSIANISSMFEQEDTVVLCHIEAFLRESSFFLSIYFSSCTAIVCYKISTDEENFNRHLFFQKALIIGLSMCLLLVIAPFIFKNWLTYKYGPLFCWITYAPTNNKTTMVIVRAIYEAIPILAGLIITLIGYIKAIKRIRELPQHIVEQTEIGVYKLLWFPLVLFVTFLPSVVNNFIGIFIKDIPPWVCGLHLGLTHSIGFTNAIVYGFQRKLYKTKYETYISSSLVYDSEPGSGRSTKQALIRAAF